MGRYLGAMVVSLGLCSCALPSYSSVDGGAGPSGGAAATGGHGGSIGGAGAKGGMGGMGGQGGSGARADWIDARYAYRKALALDTSLVLENVEDFPVPIVIPSDDDLRDHVHASGRGIVFTAADGVTKLSHEIEVFAPLSGELVAWVRVPLISKQTDTQLFMFFGDPDNADQEDAKGTWASKFRGVWHLSDNPMTSSPQIHDSTTNPVNGEVGANGAAPASVQGKAGRALSFDGAATNGDRVTMDNTADDHLDPMSGSFSFSVWLNLTVDPVVGRPLSKFQGSPNNGYELRSAPGSLTASVYAADVTKTVYLGALATGEWRHVAVVVDRTTQKLNGYSNGAFNFDVDIPDLTAVQNGQPLSLSPGGGPFGGLIDEVRIYGEALSGAWIALEHHALTKAGFLDVGPLEPY